MLCIVSIHADKVAEMTGRKQRMVERGGVFKLEQRTSDTNKENTREKVHTQLF